jgi:hypothetical protein
MMTKQGFLILSGVLLLFSCSNEVSGVAPGLAPTRWVLVDPGIAWTENTVDESNLPAGKTTIEVTAYAPTLSGWTELDSQNVVSGFRAATVAGQPVPSTVELTEVAGRPDARKVHASFDLPPQSTVVAGWFTGSNVGSNVRLAVPINGYDVPALPAFLGEKAPALTFVKSSRQCPRLMAIDVDAKGNLTGMSFVFSEAVAVGKQSTTVQVTTAARKLEGRASVGQTASLSQVGPRVVRMEFSTPEKSTEVQFSLEEINESIVPYSFAYLCVGGAFKLGFSGGQFVESGRMWFGNYALAQHLAFDHADFVKKHPEFSDAE